MLEALSAKFIATVVADGLYFDGGGLCLQIKNGGKSWGYRYGYTCVITGGRKKRFIGIGSVNDVTVKQARERAADFRDAQLRGVDPLEYKKSQEIAKVMGVSKGEVFKTYAETYISRNRAAWRNEKHADQWLSTLATYAYPVIGDLELDKINTPHILKILEPIWGTKTETANRVRGRIETILSSAKAAGLRTGDNPAAWKDNLRHILPSRSKISPVKHHAALAYTDVPAFMASLRLRNTVGSAALQFIILTACRTSEAIEATWDEFDLDGKVWTVPANRMKANRPHRVPLSESAIAVLKNVEAYAPKRSRFVFSGERHASHISNMTTLKILRDMGLNITTHGFRSSFKGWGEDISHHAREIIEAALAHVIGDKAERAYRRSDALEKRRALMADWAAFCSAVAVPMQVKQGVCFRKPRVARMQARSLARKLLRLG